MKLAVQSKQISECGEQTDKRVAQYLHPYSVLFVTLMECLLMELAPVVKECLWKITRAKTMTPFAITAATAQWVESM